MRLSNEAPPIGFALAPADDRTSGATADLEPCNETPRKLTLLPEGEGGTLTVGFVAETGDGEVGGGETGDVGVPRDSGGFDVKPGCETGSGGDAAGPPAGGAVVPDGCQAGGGDDGDE